MDTARDSAKQTAFGDLLRRYRLAAGLTQSALAERAGLSERAVNDLERDPRRSPRLESVTLLADALALEAQDRALLLAAARPELRRQTDIDTSAALARQSDARSNGATGAADSTGDQRAALRDAAALPIATTPFIGRAREVAGVCARLREPDVRLLTLTGPGGIGKTRLAIQVAATLAETYADGVCFVALGALSDPALALPTIATTLGISESAHQSAALRLAETLGAKELLLILDNFEQITGAANDIARLLAACPGLTILVTSRALLRLSQENEYAVPPLTIPDPVRGLILPDLLSYDAVAFFLQCARAVSPDFALTEANAQSIVDICVRLEGVPLAIQLAAARIKLLPLATLLSRLDQQLAILTGGPLDAPERQRTVRATLDWSYRLLDPSEQALFRRLAVFVGGWTLEAAEDICIGVGVEPAEILDLLHRLVSQSLVVVEQHEGTARYRLLEIVRLYALERLRAAGEEVEMRERHLAWFLQQAEAIDAQTWIIPLPSALSTLRPEADNFRAALAWSRRDTSGQMTLHLARALIPLWQATGAVNEGRDILRRAFSGVDPGARTSALAQALLAEIDLAGLQTDPAPAYPLLAEAIAIFRELGDERKLAQALILEARLRHWLGDHTVFDNSRDETISVCRRLGNLRALGETLWFWGDLALEQGDYVVARRDLEECIAVCRQLNDPLFLTFPLISLARVACAEGNIVQARALAEEGLALRSGAIPWLVAIALTSLGEVERCADNDERAANLFAQALDIYRDQDERAGIAWATHNLGRLALRAENWRRADKLFADALVTRYHSGYLYGVATELAGMAGTRLLAGDHVRAARLFGATEALLERSQSVLAPADRIACERDTALLRTQMEESALRSSWAAGRMLSLDEMVVEALATSSLHSGEPA